MFNHNNNIIINIVSQKGRGGWEGSCAQTHQGPCTFAPVTASYHSRKQASYENYLEIERPVREAGYTDVQQGNHEI